MANKKTEIDLLLEKINELKASTEEASKPKKEEDSKAWNVDKKKTMGFMDKMRLRFKPQKIIMINMELVNGDHVHFIVVVDQSHFVWKSKTYIVDEQIRYYDMTYKLWCLDYHENFCVPIQRKIPVEEIKKQCHGEGITDVDSAFNPVTLKLFIESQVIQKVIKGADLDKVMDFMKRMLILILVVTAITLFIVLKASGALSNLHIPGFK
jgi:hypothetical protein